MAVSADVVQILLFIGTGLLSAKIFGEMFERLKMSSIVGELLAGILIGGPLFALLSVEHEFVIKVESLQQFSQIGILLLLFIVGLEIKIGDLKSVGRQSVLISLLEVSIAYVGGFLTGFYILNFELRYALFFGLLFTATSIGVTVRTLSGLGKLDTKVGRTLLSVAILDDFLALILVLILGGVLFPSPDKNPGLEVLYLFLFITLTVIIVPQLLNFLERRFNTFSSSATHQFSIGIIFAVLVLLAFFANYLGFSGAIIAFIFGLSIQQNSIIVQDIKETFVKIGEGVFIPLFFFTVGASFQLEGGIFTLTNLLIIPLAIGAKAVGALVGSKAAGFDFKSSGQVAVGMMPRAEIVIVIAEIGLQNGIFNQEVFSMAILLVFTTVLLTPFVLKLAFRNKKKDKDIQEEMEEGTTTEDISEKK
ncbi:MAG: cation:proton antiporter [Candidatus Heimdallarchaeaceae archaeon]